MRDMSGIKSALYFLTEWFMRFIVLNLLWFVINIPTAIVTLNLVMSETNRVMYVIPLTILVPVLFFPTTTAMFAVVEWISPVTHFRNYLGGHLVCLGC